MGFSLLLLVNTISILIFLQTTNCWEINDFKCSKTKVNNTTPFCLMPDYKKDVLPTTNSPMNVTIITQINDIVKVNDNDHKLTLAMTLSTTWIEPRLHISSQSTAWVEDQPVRWTTLPINVLDLIWKPGLDIVNVKEFKINKILQTTGFLDVYEDKRLWYEIPVEVTLGCPLFDFHMYPFDTQKCLIYIGSFVNDIESIVYDGKLFFNWVNENEVAPTIQYTVKQIQALPFEEGLVNHTDYYNALGGGEANEISQYSYFGIKMVFKRRLLPYFLRIYLPSFLVVVASWIGFLIDPKLLPGRIFLNVTLLLLLINMR